MYLFNNKIYFYTDKWVAVGNGKEVNVHQPQNGVIRRMATITRNGHCFTLMELEDGRVFERSINYWEQSPYGWNEVKGLVTSKIWGCECRDKDEMCQYDEALDSMHDQCIHCGQPEERK